MTKNYVLVRSPRKLIQRHEIGYGWRDINFSSYLSFSELFKKEFIDTGKAYGRRKKQIERYFNLKEGDVVVIPTSGTIAFAKVEGTKVYNKDSSISYSENRIKVSYLKDKSDNSFIPRQALTTQLQSRLKIRMAIADLSDFSDEIDKHISSLDEGNIYTWKSEIEEKENYDEIVFKEKLLKRLKKGNKISLSAGGYGLEKLVSELLDINGYVSRIQPKNQSSGIDDIDIIAKKHNFLTDDIECLYIQVKHHTGTTGLTGLKQLTEYKNDDEYSLIRKVLISTGIFDNPLKEIAEKENIYLIEGDELVNLIYNNITQLSLNTKISLGITTTPQLI